MEMIILPFKDDEDKLIKMNIPYSTSEEQYRKWLLNLKKCKKKSKLTSLEGWSLGYDSLLSDLKQCLFVTTDDDNLINKIDSNFNVIEYN